MKKLSTMFIILGFFSIIFFIYLSFIRQRLPKDIPFELTEFKLYTLIFILIIYLYAIKQIIYFKPPNFFMVKIINIISKPLVFFDAFIKYNKFVYPYYYKLFLNSCKISFVINDITLLFIIFKIIPRIILLTIFLVDVFWLKKIEIVYYFIFLGLFPLSYNYIKYSMKYALEQYIQQLELIYDEILILEKENFNMKDTFIDDSCVFKEAFGTHNVNAIYHDEYVSIRKYIEIQAEIILNNNINDKNTFYEYIGKPFSKEEVYKQYRINHNKINCSLNDSDYEKLHEPFHILEFNLIFLYNFVNLNKKIQEFLFVKKINLVVYVLYFFIWTYILIVSLHTLKDMTLTLKLLEIITEYSKIENGFSEINLTNDVNYKKYDL